MEKNNIILVGDIHGEWDHFNHLLNHYNCENSYIIQVGDWGVGFMEKGYEKIKHERINRNLQDRNCHLSCMRGNHDSPVFFKKTNNPFGCSNITFLQDYSELNLLGLDILCIGGAISIDRQDRVEGISYWVDEAFFYDENFDFSQKKYDLVLTHTRPKSCGAFKGFDNVSGWMKKDPFLKEELIKESELVDQVYQKTKPRYFCFGHFHESSTLIHENTTFKCLDINEFWMVNHEHLLSLKQQQNIS